MFTSVAPLALTAYACVRLAEQSLRHLPADKTAPNGATDIVGGVSLYYMGVTLGLVFWGMALWFFLISLFANLACIGQLNIVNQQMQLFDLIFPHGLLFTPFITRETNCF
jgi:formate hydrogenlyase subunit 4